MSWAQSWKSGQALALAFQLRGGVDFLPVVAGKPWDEVEGVDADVVDGAAVFSGLEIPGGPCGGKERVLAFDADGADFADFTAGDDLAQGAECGVVAAV